MRRINDPFVLREVLSRLSSTPPTPAEARFMLAGRGLRANQKALEEALRLIQAGSTPSVGRQVKRPRLKSLDDLPLTPKERAIMERLRREREF